MGVLFLNRKSNVAREVFGDDVAVFEKKTEWDRIRSVSLEAYDARVNAENIEDAKLPVDAKSIRERRISNYKGGNDGRFV